MLVGIWSRATFAAFLVHMLPVALGGLAITYGYLRCAYRRELREPFRDRLEAVAVTLDRPLVTRGLAIFPVAVLGGLVGGPRALGAVAAGPRMVLAARPDPP